MLYHLYGFINTKEVRPCLVLGKFEGKNARERKYKEKIEEKKKWRKIKNGLKVDMLFLFFTLNLFYLF